MAIGDDATAAGFPLVPDSGTDGKVRYGAREINRTRDLVANVKALIQATWAVASGGTGASTKAGARTNLGITSGTADPSGGADGDVYFKVIP